MKDFLWPNWRFIVLVCACLNLILTKFSYSGFGLKYSRFLMNSEVSSTTIAWIFYLFQFSTGLGVALGEPLSNFFGWRKVNFAAGLLFSISTISSGFFDNYQYLFFTYSILTGLSVGINILICSVVVPSYFVKRRATAVGIMYLGFSIGDLVAPTTVYYVQQLYGTKSSLLMLGALYLHICVLSMVFHPIEWHEKNIKKTKIPSLSGRVNEAVDLEEYDSQGLSYLSETSINPDNKADAIHESLPSEVHIKNNTLILQLLKPFKEIIKIITSTVKNMKLLKSLRVLTMTLSSCLFFVSMGAFYMLVPFALENRGIHMHQISWILSSAGIASMIIRFSSTAIKDVLNHGSKSYLLVGISLTGISFLGIGYVENIIWLYICSLTFGAGLGIVIPLFPLAVIEYMGIDLLGKIFGLTGFFNSASNIIIGPIIGIIRDFTANYDLTLQLLSILSLLSILGWFFMPMAVKYDERKSVEKIQTHL